MSLPHDIGTTSSSYYLTIILSLYHTLIFARLILSSSVVLACCLCQVHFVGSSGVQEPLPALRHVARKESDEPSQLLSTRSYPFIQIQKFNMSQYFLRRQYGALAGYWSCMTSSLACQGMTPMLPEMPEADEDQDSPGRVEAQVGSSWLGCDMLCLILFGEV